MNDVEVGICSLCGQRLLRSSDGDVWHPFDVANACPPEPAITDFDGWRQFNAKGLRLGRPGAQYFVENNTDAG